MPDGTAPSVGVVPHWLGKDPVRTTLEEQHRQRRDLRPTGIVRLAEADVTTPQIASISGPKLDHRQEIDTDLPCRTDVVIAYGRMRSRRNGHCAGSASVTSR